MDGDRILIYRNDDKMVTMNLFRDITAHRYPIVTLRVGDLASKKLHDILNENERLTIERKGDLLIYSDDSRYKSIHDIYKSRIFW